MGLEGAFCPPAGNAALPQLRRRQVRPAQRHPVPEPRDGGALRGRSRSWTVTLEDGSKRNSRFLITAIGPLSAPTMPKFEGVRLVSRAQSFHTARWPHEPVGLRGQARRRDRHRRDRHADHPESRQDRVGQLTVFQRTPNWCCAAAQRQDHAEDAGQIKADYPEIFARCKETFSCFIHTPDPRNTFEVPRRGTRGVLGKALGESRLRHLGWQFQRHPDRPGGQRDDLRLRRAQDPPARERPGGGRKADPEEPWLRHAPRADGDQLLRGLQPGQCQAGRHQRNADRAHHADGHQDQRDANTNSTSSSTPPASTPSPARSIGSISAASAAAVEGQLATARRHISA